MKSTRRFSFKTLKRLLLNKLEIKLEADRICDVVSKRFPKYAKLMSDVFVVASGRLTTTAGRAFWMTGEIRLSSPIFHNKDNREGFRDIVLHELSHILANRQYQRNVGHSHLWRNVCVKVGGNGRTMHDLTIGPRKVLRIYTIKLACCGTPVKVGKSRHSQWKQGKVYYHPTCRANPDWRANG